MEDTENAKDKEPDMLWHYTKLDVLDKMFPPKESNAYNEGKIRLRFTNCRFTNDPTESLTLRKMIIEKKDKIISLLKDKYRDENFNYDINDKLSEISDNYIFSATRLRDSMIFWGRDYAGTDGIAIGFNNINDFKKVIYLDDFSDEHIKNAVNIMPRQYYLDKAIRSDEFTQIPDIANSEDICYPLNEFIDLYSIIYKSKSWEHEAEFRIISTNVGERLYRSPKLHKEFKEVNLDYKILGGVLNPKIECIGNIVKKVCYRLFDKDIINSITLGPDCKPEYEEAVKFYLITNGYDNITVSRSHAFDLRHHP